jgi:hypothetical protein
VSVPKTVHAARRCRRFRRFTRRASHGGARECPSRASPTDGFRPLSRPGVPEELRPLEQSRSRRPSGPEFPKLPDVREVSLVTAIRQVDPRFVARTRRRDELVEFLQIAALFAVMCFAGLTSMMMRLLAM